jgi:hypothetical protein
MHWWCPCVRKSVISPRMNAANKHATANHTSPLISTLKSPTIFEKETRAIASVLEISFGNENMTRPEIPQRVLCARYQGRAVIDRSVRANPTTSEGRRPVSDCLSIYRGRGTTRQQNTIGFLPKRGNGFNLIFWTTATTTTTNTSMFITPRSAPPPNPSRGGAAATVVFTERSKTMAVQSLVACPQHQLSVFGCAWGVRQHAGTPTHTDTNTQTQTHTHTLPSTTLCVLHCVSD